jgi:hypothetical protein
MNKAIRKRDAYYKDVVNKPNYVINKEAIMILMIIMKSDFKALFLVDVNVRHKKRRLIVLALLDIGC